MADLPQTRLTATRSHIIALLALTVVSLVLVRALGAVGVLLSCLVIAAGTVLVLRRDSAREIESLRNSVTLSATDISLVLEDWEAFRTSGAPEHVRDRDSHRPALLDPNSEISSVRRFHAAAEASERFLAGLPEQSHDLKDVASLTALLTETDQRSVALNSLWHRARRDAAAARRR
ncbi:MAG TPA: hypothetical protein H9870_12575 [Candidatus Corynebacterium avicola]|uniref:Uncharacterized protein n=1 Tax=Candidatus Corynebacterium avicola TaxID=2838527 RepID=A0A9D1RQR4_9CORY|nr:hypothetical protein [Candidatus Corynebacterium avicola]